MSFFEFRAINFLPDASSNVIFRKLLYHYICFSCSFLTLQFMLFSSSQISTRRRTSKQYLNKILILTDSQEVDGRTNSGATCQETEAAFLGEIFYKRMIIGEQDTWKYIETSLPRFKFSLCYSSSSMKSTLQNEFNRPQINPLLVPTSRANLFRVLSSRFGLQRRDLRSLEKESWRHRFSMPTVSRYKITSGFSESCRVKDWNEFLKGM